MAHGGADLEAIEAPAMICVMAILAVAGGLVSLPPTSTGEQPE